MRNNREKKKMYVELLEKKVQALTEELSITKKQLDCYRVSLDQAREQAKAVCYC